MIVGRRVGLNMCERMSERFGVGSNSFPIKSSCALADELQAPRKDGALDEVSLLGQVMVQVMMSAIDAAK